MAMIELTPQERDKFALYLEQRAESDLQISQQLETLGHTPMIQKLKGEAMAAQVIAQRLRDTEVETLDSSS